MDFWERKDDLLISNWVHVNMIDIFMQMGIDVFQRYRDYRKENGL